jgi:diaminopimelate epimerase
MRMFNADGSEAEMCGNGIRCVAKYAFEHGLSKNNPMLIETGRGVLTLQLQVEAGKVQSVTVDMGQPILSLPEIPVNGSIIAARKEPHEYILPIRYGSEKIAINQATFVSMGNPHVVMFVDDVAQINLSHLGPRVENYEAFPKRINAHWVQVKSRSEVTMRTWERGSGITLACGTGACAVAVAGALTGRTDRKVLAHLPGGDLALDWREADNCVYMTGPAVEVFSGEWPDDF